MSSYMYCHRFYIRSVSDHHHLASFFENQDQGSPNRSLELRFAVNYLHKPTDLDVAANDCQSHGCFNYQNNREHKHPR